MRVKPWPPVLALTLLAAACGGNPAGGHGDGGDAGPTQTQVTQTIGFDGGTITLDGATVTFPMGALAADTQITLTHTVDAPPSGFTSGARVWQLGPAATAITRPVTVSLPLVGDAGTAAAYWSDPSATGFERLGAEVGSGQVRFGVVRLGSGFVGTTGGHDTVTVYGLVATIHKTPAGGTPEATDLRAAAVSAYVPNASHGLDPYTATGDQHGIIRAPGVPPSPSYVLHYAQAPDDLTFSSHDATVDLTTFSEVRPGVVLAGGDTPLVAHVTGTEAWAGGDLLILTAPSVGNDAIDSSTYPSSNGATSFDATFNFNGQGLLTPSDEGIVVQLNGTRSPHRYDFGARSSGKVTGVALTSGHGATTSVAMSALGAPHAHSLNLSIDRSALQAWFATVPAPSGTAVVNGWSGEVAIEADPMSSPFMTHPALVWQSTIDDQTASLDYGTLTYEDPYTAGWHRRFSGSFTYLRTFSVPGPIPCSGYRAEIQYDVTMSLADAGTAALTPKVGAPADIRVEGHPTSQIVTGVGVTPQITWQPASTGAAPAYYAVSVATNAAPDTPFAWLYTQDPEIRIPPGILTAGTYYALTVYAFAGAGADAAHLRSPVGLELFRSGVKFPPIQP